MRCIARFAALPVLAALASLPLAAHARAITIPKGTEVDLAFDQATSSKTAREGDKIRLHVIDDVTAGGQTVIKAGTPVTGIITKVDKRKHFGVNAKLHIELMPVAAADGEMVPLAPTAKGKYTGSRTDHAGAAAGAGAVILGPIGLVGGYFVVGKPVNINVGDKLTSEVPADTLIKSTSK